VVEAGKAAEADVIRPAGETPATRSLLNTAKVTEGSAHEGARDAGTRGQLNRRIFVFAGLDPVLNGPVKLC